MICHDFHVLFRQSCYSIPSIVWVTGPSYFHLHGSLASHLWADYNLWLSSGFNYADSFPAWVIKNGSQKDDKIQFNWSKNQSITLIFSFQQACMDKIFWVRLWQVDKLINAMYRKLQKNLTSEELLPSLWDKCKVS